MVGDMDSSGSLNAQVIHQITNGIRSKVAFQVECFFLNNTFFYDTWDEMFCRCFCIFKFECLLQLNLLINI